MIEKLDQALIIKKPLSFGDFFDHFLSLYKRFFFQGIFLGILFQGVPLGLRFFMGDFLGNHALNQFGIIAMLLLNFFGGVYGSIVLIKVTKQVCVGDSTSWRNAINLANNYYWRVLGVEIVTLMWCVICLICFIAPGVFAIVNCFLVSVIMVLEGSNFSESWKRSKDLAKGNKWRIIFSYFAFFTLSGLIDISGHLPRLFIANLSPFLDEVFKECMYLLSLILTTSFMPIFATLLYFDIRVRKEALDLEMQCEAIEFVDALPA